MFGNNENLYADYVETTVDSGNLILFVVIGICFGSLVVLPFLVSCCRGITRRRRRHKLDRKNLDMDGTLEYVGSGSDEDAFDGKDAFGGENEDAFDRKDLEEGREIHQRTSSSKSSHSSVSEMFENEVVLEKEHSSPATAATSRSGGSNELASSMQRETFESEAICNFSWLRPSNICKSLWFFVGLAELDHETKKLLGLTIPFTISAFVETAVDLTILAIVSHMLGTEAMVAYALTSIIVGLTSEFIGGILESQSSLASMALGARNYRLAGSYLQLCITLELIAYVPLVILWNLFTDDVMLWLGFDETIANLAQDFSRVAVWIDVVGDVSEAYSDFQEVIGHEWYANVLGVIESISAVGVVVLFTLYFDPTLVLIGVALIVNTVFFFLLNVAITRWKGWMFPFYPGLIGHNALKDRDAVRQVIYTALPLGFGNIMAYAEWEVLTVFAAHLGPAEAATWAMLSFVWDNFEAAAGGIGDAAELRCAYHCGEGAPEAAKQSAYKSMFLANIISCLVSGIFLTLRNILPRLLTGDPTLQRMLHELFPLMAIGNVTMNLGIVCFYLVGAQLRYRLATLIFLGCSWGITMPLGGVATYILNLDLQGLVAAVVIGYTFTATIITIVLFCSDWEKLAANIHAIHLESDSEDESCISSSSSSSSSSDSSCISDNTSSSKENRGSGRSGSSKGSIEEQNTIVRWRFLQD